MVLSLRPLASSRAQESRRVASSYSSTPPGYQTPEDGVGVNSAPHSVNPDGTMGLY
jgi:hypothetical protein